MKRFWLSACFFCCTMLSFAQLRENCEDYQARIDAGDALPRDFFLTACCYSNNEQRDDAFTYLNLAIDNGFHDAVGLINEPFLKRLHSDPRWAPTVARINALDQEILSHINPLLIDLGRSAQADFQEREVSAEIHARQEARIKQVADLFSANEIKSADDYYYAAIVYRYGMNTEDYVKGQQFIARALRMGSLQPDLQRVKCELEDLYLWSIQKPQVWGTQLRREGDTWTYEPFDIAARDDGLRVMYGLSSLEDIQREIRELKAGKKK